MRFHPAPALAAVLTLSFAPSAFAADAPGCSDPAWAPKQLPGFERSSCEHYDWTPFEIELPGGLQKLEGRLDTVTYALTDESKNPSNDKAREYFVALAKKAGATLETEPGHGFSAALRKKGPKGDTWFVYEHGSGNDESTSSYNLHTFTPRPLEQRVKVRAADADWSAPKTCERPPWLVTPFPGFTLAGCEDHDFDQVTVDLPDGPKTFAGHVYSVHFELAEGATSPVPAALARNYVAALEGIGARLLTSRDDVMTAFLTRHTKQGDHAYLYTHGSGSETTTQAYDLLWIAPASKPGTRCTMVVYGVNFDFDKATLRADSEPVLQQVLAAFQGSPDYRAEIGGHTDDVGDKAYNQKLSARRAEAVKAWLTAHGVAAARLTSAGYGDTRPLVPNTSDENRAKNRRVELKRAGCTP